MTISLKEFIERDKANPWWFVNLTQRDVWKLLDEAIEEITDLKSRISTLEKQLERCSLREWRATE